MNDNIKINPSGKMPVAPNPGGNRPGGGGQKIFGPAAVTALAVMGVAVLLIRFVYAVNAERGGFWQKPETGQSEAEIAPPCLADEEIWGAWSAEDCVENVEDFDPKAPNHKQQGVKLPYYRAEFFDDGTAMIKSSEPSFISASEGVPCRWTNGDAPDILPGIGERVVVRAIKRIDGKDYMFADFAELKSMAEAPAGYYVFVKNKPKYVYPGDDFRNRDLRNYDFSQTKESIHSVSFNENTIFPSTVRKAALRVMERGANPGLGIRGLHGRGITGKGVNVAIIDEPLDMGHPEYKGKIAEYKDFGSGAASSAQGPAIAGLLAGDSMGTAPGVNIYYAAVPAWEMYDAQYYASALDWIIEINAGLPEGEKIKVACISPNPENPLPWINVDKYLASFMRAEKEGILVLDCTNEHGAVLGACSRDYENPEDVSLCKPKGAYRIAIAPYHYDGEARDIYLDEEEADENMLRVPISCKTLPETVELADGSHAYKYRYDSKGQLSWALPYAAGVLAMGWQVRPGLGGDEMMEILFDTAQIDSKGNKYICPEAFIDYLGN